MDSAKHQDKKILSTSQRTRRSHPAQYGETFDWSANLIA